MALFFGIKSRSPATMAAAAVAVMIIALFATAVPAWRAARVDAAPSASHLNRANVPRRGAVEGGGVGVLVVIGGKWKIAQDGRNGLSHLPRTIVLAAHSES